MFYVHHADGNVSETASEQQAIQWLMLWPRSTWVEEVVTTRRIVAVKKEYADKVQIIDNKPPENP